MIYMNAYPIMSRYYPELSYPQQIALPTTYG
ncbi:hypothetical protein AmaxDRAFT_1314 [Limnospira maxima CS-328]|uniref:Uncharacterized protein n=1 Tax=Limnospira maxima CS-328 TaxID=513049 RepID=B5VXS2_LIMMA|nr:hypothetical protein AmaxDRAFT_5313 [Limnospira maxima CS-328]EDZ93113.1 hypothetical protein AmaxDRAFT_4164 [Limnospira maxima CS-328]EDZ93423.1 hypothetical protein AmaxDRAFT_3811 [Limnospira maxima CS-328]EDZ95919.1 hypothetical protein AmaxDRAFT_1314 [Limnospira maxima CS-328]